MLNLTIKPGEYFVIGDDIRVIFTGGTANNARIMIDAPRSYNIVRGKVLEQPKTKNNNQKPSKKEYYIEPKLSKEQLEKYLRQQQADKMANL